MLRLQQVVPSDRELIRWVCDDSVDQETRWTITSMPDCPCSVESLLAGVEMGSAVRGGKARRACGIAVRARIGYAPCASRGPATGSPATAATGYPASAGEYVHVAIDDHGRIAFSAIYPDETRARCAEEFQGAFLRVRRSHKAKERSGRDDRVGGEKRGFPSGMTTKGAKAKATAGLSAPRFALRSR